MPKPEGKIFQFQNQSKVRTDFLETLPYQGEEQVVRIETSELTAVCPFSGLPDFAKVTIEYIPKDKIVELKSLKYYFISFRNIGIYQEDLTNRIYKDLKKLLKPQWIKVTTVYNTRGGIDVICTIDSNRKVGT